MGVFGKIVYGLQVAAIGLVVVFLGLAILIGFITLMAQVFKAVDGKKAAKAAEAARAAEAAKAAQAAKAATAAPAPVAEPVVEEVTDESELIAVDRRKLRFAVRAWGGEELIGEGEHERFVIDNQRFLEKALAKKR